MIDAQPLLIAFQKVLHQKKFESKNVCLMQGNNRYPLVATVLHHQQTPNDNLHRKKHIQKHLLTSFVIEFHHPKT